MRLLLYFSKEGNMIARIFELGEELLKFLSKERGLLVNYVLKTKKELDRLQVQSENTNYSIQKEFENIVIKPGAKILDIGCGAGTLIEYVIQNYQGSYYACDLTLDHVNFCKEKFKDKLEVFQHDIVASPLNEKYDHIFMRYVPHHLGMDLFVKALLNIKQSLNKQGKFTVIDLDGMFINFGTSNFELKKSIEHLVASFPGDFILGRSMASVMKDTGFKDISTEIQTMNFNQQEDRQAEAYQMQERFKLAQALLEQIFPNEFERAKFQKDFINEFNNVENSYFVTKFIVTGSCY